MTQWYVKELSRLTGVTVQTLHHYDKINLLKPSIRLPNGYRVYSEGDLLRLQQIIALKYFGFNLPAIHKILSDELSVRYHLTMQAKCLEEKAVLMLQASARVKEVLAKAESNKSFPWQDAIKMIEVYQMTHQLEKQKIEQEFKNWNAELQDAMASIDLSIDPGSDAGIKIAKTIMDHTNKLYEMQEKRKNVLELSEVMSSGGQPALEDQASMEWLGKAMNALEQHLGKRVKEVLAQVGQQDYSIVSQAWESLLQEMYGNAQPPRKDLYQLLLADPEICVKAKDWLKTHRL